MSIWRLVLREFAYRKLTALLALLSVAVATACMVGSLLVLRAHDLQTEAISAAMQAETEARTKQLQEDYRKIMLELGFNVFIVPRGDKAADVYSDDFGRAEMPESYADKLGNAGIITINHLRPILSKRVDWPQQGMKIVLTGIRDEVTQAGRKRKEPLAEPVKPGQALLGFVVAKQAKLKPGDTIDLLGRKLTVGEIESFRGTSDDITVWVELAVAQELLDKRGKINAMQAINCLAEKCHPDASGIPAVDEEISRVLPETQVLIDMSKAKARIDTRGRAAKESVQALAAEKERRATLRAQISQVTSILGPVAMVAAAIWVALWMLGNVRQRSGEIGVLRAIGVRGRQIMLLFLGKALIVGLLGALIGCAVGIGVAAAWSRTGEPEITLASLIQPLTVALVLGAVPLVAIVASWPPALLAARQDPAAVLREE
jgi:ABC-type lipoprotein release transport system permease subunit